MNLSDKVHNSDIKFFADFIESGLGIVYEEDNYFQLESRLNEICKTLGVENIAELRRQAGSSGITGEFKKLLLDSATNNETSFYRDPKAFHALEDMLLPKYIGRGAEKKKQLRIWTVACSTGQEPYTLSMIADRIHKKLGTQFDFLATDISDRVLQYAKAGCYSELELKRGMPTQDLSTYFAKTERGDWQIKSHLRQKIEFKKMNLLEINNIHNDFDLILCRNVLIYQRPEKKQMIINRLTNFLSTGGYIMLGAAESLVGLDCGLVPEIVDGVNFYKKA